MLGGNFQLKMNLDNEKVRKSLDELFEKAEINRSLEEFNELRFILDDYLEQGYRIKDYVHRYNKLFQKIFN